jgi:alpha-beta hydrolase superfamily lysophospholipase
MRAVRIGGWIVLVLCIAAATAWLAARPSPPDAFYDPPPSLPTRPGLLLRQEPFDRKVPSGARAWRILYTTTRENNVPAMASAIVMVSATVPNDPRPVIAWAHGTTGVVPGCAPSLLDDPFANVPALQALLDQGWIYVATDYVGQGTAGPHPYLIGEGEAHSVLDAVRAARHAQYIHPSNVTVVWGHSQGGHAALWTAIAAPTYAPDVPLAGVAVFAPASDLKPMIEKVQHMIVGRIMTTFILQAYSNAYPDVVFDGYATGLTKLMARDMAKRCLAGPQTLYSVGEAVLAARTIFSSPPNRGTLGARLAQNTPDRPISQPLLIAQGLADPLVLPNLQAEFVRRRCRDGQALEYRQYAGLDHLSLVASGSPLTGDLIRWTRERIEGVPVLSGCRNEVR